MSLYTLFRAGDFVLASGRVSDFKIDCDALTKDDWWAIGEQLYKRVTPYGHVLGVPRGGLRLASVMREFARPDEEHGVLVVDDVWTTGGSVSEFVKEHVAPCCPYQVAVAFARSQPPPEVVALFVMTPERSRT